MKGAKITGGTDSLERFQKALRDADSMRVKVGILGKKNGRDDGVTNSEVGAKNEFGFFVAEGPFKGSKVPARSFLRMPLKELLSDLPESFKARAATLLMGRRLDELFESLDGLASKAISEAFSTSGGGKWAPNAPTTILIKSRTGGSDMPLIDTGQLRRSIMYEITGRK